MFKLVFQRKNAKRFFVFLGMMLLFWLIWPAFQPDMVKVDPNQRKVEVFDTVVRGYENAKLRWQMSAKTVWTGYNPFLFRGEAVGPGIVFDDEGKALINDIFSGQVQVDSKTKILYAYDTVTAYFIPRKNTFSFQTLDAAEAQKPVKVTAGGLKYVEASKRTYLTDGVEIIQGQARIRPYVDAELDNNTNIVTIENGFQLFLDDMVVSGNRMEIEIDRSVSTIQNVTLVRQGKATTNMSMDPRERELRKKTAVLTADHMRFEQHEDMYMIAVSGNVKAIHDGKSFVGDTGTYDSEKETMSLVGNVHVSLPELNWLLLPDRKKNMKNADIKKTLGLVTSITCDSLRFDSGTHNLILFGNVHVKQQDKDVRCTKLVYDDYSQTMVLSGNVTIIKDGQDSLVASLIVVDLKDETYKATGQIQTEFRVRKAAH